MSFRRIISMRNLLLAGTAGLFLSLGAATAYAVPQNSPYATMVPPDAVDGYVADNGLSNGCQGYVQDVGCPPAGMTEGRSAFVDPEYAYGGWGYTDPGFGYYGDSRAMGSRFEGGYGHGGNHGGR
jgi:hypothetical protein